MEYLTVQDTQQTQQTTTKQPVNLCKLPIEICFYILQYTDVVTVSKMCCVNRYFNKTISEEIWSVIDRLHVLTDTVLIPVHIETFYKYRYLVDWGHIILYNQNCDKRIPEKVLMWIPDRVDLEMIAVYQNFSDDLIRTLHHKISWSTLLEKQDVPLDVIRYMVTNQTENRTLSTSDWYNIWSYQRIDYKFFVENLENVQWHPISSNKEIISFEFIEHFGDNIVWHEFTKHSIHENVLQRFIHKFDFICWNNISRYTDLSEQFINTYYDFLDIGSILRYQTLSMTLIRSIVNSLSPSSLDFYLPTIGIYQDISKEFILEYKEYLPMRTMIKNKTVPRTIIHEIYGTTNYSKNN